MKQPEDCVQLVGNIFCTILNQTTQDWATFVRLTRDSQQFIDSLKNIALDKLNPVSMQRIKTKLKVYPK